MFHAGQRGRTIVGELFRDGEAPRGLGEQLREYFEVRFRTEKYGVPYFWPKAKQSDPRKEAAGARARNAVEVLNGGHRHEALGAGRLSRRRHSCPKDVRGFEVNLA
jgi:hypothetical protein